MLEEAKLLLSPLHVVDLYLSIPQTVRVGTVDVCRSIEVYESKTGIQVSVQLASVRMYLVDRLSFADNISEELLCIGGYLLQNSILIQLYVKMDL